MLECIVTTLIRVIIEQSCLTLTPASVAEVSSATNVE